ARGGEPGAGCARRHLRGRPARGRGHGRPRARGSGGGRAQRARRSRTRPRRAGAYAAAHRHPGMARSALRLRALEPGAGRDRGGDEPLGHKGRPSRRVTWEEVLATRPEVVIIACCGFDLARTRTDLPLLHAREGWADLPAVRDGRVYAVDGSQYFSRPGPRV